MSYFIIRITSTRRREQCAAGTFSQSWDSDIYVVLEGHYIYRPNWTLLSKLYRNSVISVPWFPRIDLFTNTWLFSETSTKILWSLIGCWRVGGWSILWTVHWPFVKTQNIRTWPHKQLVNIIIIMFWSKTVDRWFGLRCGWNIALNETSCPWKLF